MNRFETTIVALAAFALAALHAPVFGQVVRFDVDGKDTGAGKQVAPDVKNGKQQAKVVKKGHEMPPPPPKEPTFTATGGFESTKEKARESAVRAAVEKLHDYLAKQDPPITQMPSDRRSTELVRKMLLDDQEKITEGEPVVTDSGKSEPMYRSTIAVRVEPHHIRELRSQERSSEALWILAGLGGLAALFAVFFRIDAWTKGYLTNWLVLGTVGTAALLGGLWWMAK
jgi:hypothetical protein